MIMDNLVDSEHDLTQVGETSVNTNSNSPSQARDTHPYDDNLPLQALNSESGQHSRFSQMVTWCLPSPYLLYLLYIKWEE